MSVLKKSNKKIIGLNGLKMLALLGVLIYHTFPAFLPGGYFGVILFFVISGFLSTRSILNELHRRKFSLLQYYKKRFLRIYPKLFIVLSASIGILSLTAPDRLANTQQEVASILLGFNNYWQIKVSADYFANLSNNSPFTHLWYIAILIQFDVLIPLMLTGYSVVRNRWGYRTGTMILGLITFITALIMPVQAFISGETAITSMYYSTHTRIFSLFAGVTLAAVVTEKQRLHVRRSSPALKAFVPELIGLIITIVIYLKADGRLIWVYQYGMSFYTIISCIMLEAVSRKPTATGRLMDNRISNTLSRYSYEIYLWQYPVLVIFTILKLNYSWYMYVLQLVIIMLLSVWLYKLMNYIF